LPEMALSVALTAGHRANRQHSLTLALFEIRDQESCCSHFVARVLRYASSSARKDESSTLPMRGVPSSKKRDQPCVSYGTGHSRRRGQARDRCNAFLECSVI
jgi:hypothetical protein